MGSVAKFPQEMQPARPFVPPSDPREQPVLESEGAYQPPSEEDWRRLEGVETVTLLVELHGVATVARWLRHVALIKGEAIPFAAEGSQR